jgi:hypothetical protein
MVSFNVEGRDDEEPVVQYYSAGDAEKIQPSDDGFGFEGVDDDKEFTGLGEKTLAGVFLKHLVQAGFPEEALLDEDKGLSAIDGTTGHVKQIERPKYGNLKGSDGKTLAVFTRLDEIPGKKKKKGAKTTPKAVVGKKKKKDADEEEEAPAAKKKTAKKKAPVEDDDEEEEDEDDVESKAKSAIVRAIKKFGAMAKAKLSQRLNKALADDDDRVEIISMALSDKFLKAGAKAGDWVYDGRQIGPEEAEEEDEEEDEDEEDEE